MTERWLPVVGFEGRYEVSDLGRVRSLDRMETYTRIDQYSGRNLIITRRHAGRMLRPGHKQSGHVSVALGREHGSVDVHILVLEAFIGSCPTGKECCHENDVADDNRLENLSWGTRSKNLHDAVRNGKKSIGEKHHKAKLTEVQVLAIRQASGPRGLIKSLAEKFDLKESSVRGIRDRKTWKHVA